MSVRSRDYLTQLDARVFPTLGLIQITESIRRARAVKHDQLAKLMFAIQHVPQSGAQRCDTRAHRDQNQIATAMSIQIKTVAGHAKEIDALTFLHIENCGARSSGSFDEEFQLA